MIRIEGISIVAARLAAARRSAKLTETARSIRPPRMRQRLFLTPATTDRRRPKANAQVCAKGTEKRNA
jgi:hypothetical protein